jgi:phosphoglycolate phosphatase-like HAD superfamily hydrolase
MPKNILISWDIDGTLVLGTKATQYHLEAFKLACTELFGPCDTPEPFLGHSIDGWMDKGILTAMIEKLGFPASEENIARGKARMEEIFLGLCSEVPEVPVGIVDTLEALSRQPNITMAVASGNFPRIAWQKLELAGLAKYFPDRIGGLGMFIERKDALLAARKRAEELKGIQFDVIVHVGDTPTDVRAAVEAGAIPIGVRTGRFVYPEYPQPGSVFANIVEARDALWKILELT